MTELVEAVEDRGLDHDAQPLQFDMSRTRKGTIDTDAHLVPLYPTFTMEK